MKRNCVIIGGGPAGYTAAIYAQRAGLQPVLFEGMLPGGQLTTTTHVANYPGFADGIDANALMQAMRAQAENLGAELRGGIVTGVEAQGNDYKVTLDGGETIVTKTVVIATGASAKYLGLPSEEKYKGLGVSACATCDGFFYRRKTVAVVGGGDTACEEATYLASLCKKVYMIVRRNVLRASEAMQKRVFETENIEVLWECSTKEILGDEYGVTGARLQRKDGEVFDVQLDGFFLGIGHHPNSDLFHALVEVDENGYIRTAADCTRTTAKGIFAAGDVQDTRYRQAITAAASGAQAAMDVKAYLDSEYEK
ncbi:MAG: thioredoxin-disulfide reductase [Bacteroidales bacterium]|nr:thioredoxin-disulfide reductase [Bacteroidales bacterium]